MNESRRNKSINKGPIVEGKYCVLNHPNTLLTKSNVSSTKSIEIKNNDKNTVNAGGGGGLYPMLK